MNILIVEDDKDIREGIIEYLSEFGYIMVGAKDGMDALVKFKENDFKLVILDINLPFVNGLDVLKEIRKTSEVPVLMLTAFSDEEYKLKAFTNLADGYIEKPLSLSVLKVRIESLIKRYYGDVDIFKYNGLEVNFTAYSAKYNNREIDVNAKEIEILKFLLMNEGHVLTRAQIIDNLWKDTEEVPYDRVIDVYIKELRKKFGLDCIVTVRNVGYKLERR